MKVILITGNRGEGKTTMAEALLRMLEEKNIKAGGILAPGYFDKGKRTGFDIKDIRSGISLPLCSVNNENSIFSAGPFGFYPEGYSFGLSSLDIKYIKYCRVVFIDEIGPLELSGMGWSDRLSEIMSFFDGLLILLVRKSLIIEVISRWSLNVSAVLDCSNNTAEDAIGIINYLLENSEHKIE